MQTRYDTFDNNENQQVPKRRRGARSSALEWDFNY
jgi:hypothetical protein